MEIYKDMVEKLKYHKSNIINAFIKKNYYPSTDEINNKLENNSTNNTNEINEKLKLIDSRLALFETYISKPGGYINTKELNHAFKMIAKDIEILYKVLEDILINDYSRLNIYLEAALSELESKADYYKKRCMEEVNSTSLGTTVFFQANNWNITENNEVIAIDLGDIELIDGSEISCFANISNINEEKIMFKFSNNDFDKSFNALPYNYNNNSYKVPGELSINNIPINMPTASLVDDYITIYHDINFNNKYKIAGAKGGMQVTYKKTGEIFLYKFADLDNTFVAPQDCYVEFFILDGNTIENSHMEYSFTEAPVSVNFSLQNGEVLLNKEAVRVFIECQEGLGMNFNITNGTVYASLEDAIISNKNTLLYKGNWDIRDFVLREYVKTKSSTYNVKVLINSQEDISSDIESIYIKDVTQ